jgi:predicted MPP superfamily phosphohydrolase
MYCKLISWWLVKRVFRDILFILGSVGLWGCTVVPTGNFDNVGVDVDQGKKLVVWMLSDIHYKNEGYSGVFEAAIQDINENIGPVDMAVMAGDLLQSRSPASAFESFLQARNRAKVSEWYEIAGNHDVRSGTLFYEYFKKPPYYAVETGNLLFLFLSDQSVSSRTDISDEAFFWWRNMVEGNRDRIIITVSHAQLAGSGLLGSSVSSRVIHRSSRFENVLNNENVALWISGHCHLPQRLSGTMSVRKNLGGTCFINVSSISNELLLDSESKIVYFQDGSDIVWIRSRNHTQKKFNTALDVPLLLKQPFKWGEGKAHSSKIVEEAI